jgi:hypothetical protein
MDILSVGSVTIIITITIMFRESKEHTKPALIFLSCQLISEESVRVQ